MLLTVALGVPRATPSGGLTQSFLELVKERGIEAPILAEIHKILYEGKPAAEALAALMGRELKRE